MKKTIFLMAITMLFACGVHAQDSTQHKSSATQTHKKTMHQNKTTTTTDSIDAGKIRTNPNGKMSNKSSTIKRRKTTINSSVKSSTDSTK